MARLSLSACRSRRARCKAPVSASATAVAALRGVEPASAEQAELDAIAALERALEQVQQLQEQQQQDDLRERTEPSVNRERLTRRDRATLRGLAEEQRTLADSINELREQIAGQVVFEHMHGRVDTLVARAIDAMRSGDGTVRVPLDQAQTAATLRAMADALVPPPSENDFQENNNAGGGGGGWGGGGGGVIPPAAQLKLLRAEQAMLRDETSLVHGLLGKDPAGDTAQAAVVELADRQRELAGLAERLQQQLSDESGAVEEGLLEGLQIEQPGGQP